MFKQVLLAGFMPKTISASLLLTALAFCWPAMVSAIEREIAWTEDYEAAMQRAATTNGIVLLHFYGDYCPPCKLLDKKTFHDPALVSKMNEHLVPVKINADRRRDLAQKFQVTRWPTDIYLFPNGDEIYRGVSNADPAVYCKTIERIALRHRDWTVERNATARAKEKRQDRALAAHTPQIHTEQPIHAGNAGHSVRTQAASWTNQPDASQNVSVSPTPASGTKWTGSKVIDNPYVAKQPLIVPAAPSSPNQTPLPGDASSNLPSREPVPNFTAQSVVAQPVSTQRDIHAQPPQPNTQSLQQNNPIAAQQVYAETIGLGGFCPVTLIESLKEPNAKGWVEGEKSFAVRHRGRVYHCVSERARQSLLSNPDRFTPCLSGFDIVHFCKEGELHDGKCEFGCIQEGTNRVFLFETKANYDEFTRNSAFYSRALDGDRPERVANELSGTQNR